jgi:tetratricopeptide (TPR) repeat protein
LLLTSSLILALTGTVSDRGAAHAREDLLRINQAFPSPDEFDYLPRYCWARMQILGGKDVNELDPMVRDEVLKWRAVVGDGIFVHLHHYCGGLDRMRRYWLSVDRDGRQLSDTGQVTGGQRMTLEAAISEFRYVQGYMKNMKSALYPDMLVAKATAHWQLGETEKAVADLLAATMEKRDFETPYLILSQIAEEQGNFQDAVDILELGIKQAPNATLLRSRLDKLKAR